MARVIKRTWHSSLVPGLPRRERQGCRYEAYLPDPLAGRPITLDGTTAADSADAEQAVARLNRESRALIDSEAVARLLLRAEAVASSRIEGLEIGARRLLRAQVARAAGEDPGDVTALEVLNNVDSMSWAVGSLTSGRPITVDDLCGVHHRLLVGTSRDEHAGRIRTEQNWIGGSSYNPCRAAFVPPPHEHVEALLEDLCAFCSTDDLPPTVQAAIAHAQVETIHPFVDGNGRTGRALIQIILRRRGLAPHVVPPVSLVLATWATDYIDALTDTRYRGSWSSIAAHGGLNRWVALFATATRRSVADAEAYEARVGMLKAEWRARLSPVRAGSSIDLLIDGLPGAPIVTVRSAAQLIDRSEQAVNEAVPRLVAAGVLKQTTLGRRNRAFEAPELLDAFTDLERMLASPGGDARSSAPARRVPRRPPTR